jgi:hypothetical protein
MRNIVVAAVLVLAAAAVFGAARQDTKPTMPMMSGMIQNSLMNIPGVEVSVTDTPDGSHHLVYNENRRCLRSCAVKFAGT